MYPPRQASTWQRIPRSAGHGGQVGDGVDHTLGIGRGRADHHDGVVVHRVGHGVDVGGEVGADSHPSRLDVEVVGGLLEGGVGTGGHHHVGASDASLRPTPVPSRLGRLQQGLGAPGGQVATDAGPAILGELVGPEEAGGYRDDVPLHPSQAGKDRGVERVLRRVHGGGPLEQAVDVVAGRIDQAEHAPTAPIAVVRAELAHPGQHLVGIESMSWQAAVSGSVGQGHP